MPHKHKRRHHDERIYDLPPSTIARPLPTRDSEIDQNKRKKGGRNGFENSEQKSTNHAKNAPQDDTPKAFRRLMMQVSAKSGTHKLQSGLIEDEVQQPPTKKRKRYAINANSGPAAISSKTSRSKPTATTGPSTSSQSADQKQSQLALPKILPGEKLSDFAARVDRELPLAGMKNSRQSAGATLGLQKLRENRQTKHERRLLRLQRQWRDEESRICEREAAEREEREAEMEEELDLWNQWEAEARTAKAKKKGPNFGKKKNTKSKKARGTRTEAENDSEDLDPWAKLNNRERLNQPANPFEVAQAPPQLKPPREVFKVRFGAQVDVANVPAASGSLRRREELAGERRNIVEEYRRLMALKRQ